MLRYIQFRSHALYLQLYDETRIDHFRAFVGYWAVAADSETGEGWLEAVPFRCSWVCCEHCCCLVCDD